MSRAIKVATIQMDITPAPAFERLARAEELVTEAAYNQAQLIVLPELFNTGYTYHDSNYRRAEPLTGPTVTWLRDTAAYLNVHLAGSLLLLDHTHVYNSLLLCAPDQRMWRYDKNYPWGWERAYYRAGRGVTIADTELGRMGLMICWDTAHPDLWRQYAGKVDLMLISSCPPNVSNPTYRFPNGDEITPEQLGPLMASFKDGGQRLFGDMVNEQTAWLGVPAINSTGIGHFDAEVPAGLLSLLSILPAAPWLMKYQAQAKRMRVVCDMVPAAKIVNAAGQVLTALKPTDGETFALAEVTLPDHSPQPLTSQPPSRLPYLTYLVSDWILPLLMVPSYRYGLRRVWGKYMAPLETVSKQWLALLGLSVLTAFLAGWFLGRRRK